MEKVNIGANIFVYPMAVVLVGTQVDERPNFMAVGWITRANSRPPMIAVGINKNHHTPQGIMENNTFSVNFPDSKMLKVTDYCGIVSGKKVNKSELFNIFYGDTGAPMITECPLNMECRLVQTVDLPSNYLFIGEIITSYTEEKYMKDGKIDIKKLDPLVLSMPDNSYWKIGDFAGKAWGDGKNFIK